MERQGLFRSLTLAMVFGFTAVNSQDQANTPVRELTSKIGQSANLSCEAHGLPLFACYWRRTDINKIVTKDIIIDREGSMQGKSDDAGYGYIGSGFGRGTCGLQIKNVKEEDNGNWTCTLTAIESATQYEGTVRLNVLKAPEGFRFDPNINKIESLVDVDPKAKLNISCGSYNGQPAPKYKWFIGNDSITDGLVPYENSTDKSGNRWVYQTLADYKYTAKDNGKVIRCVLDHPALDKDEHREVVHKITVYYQPRAEPKPLPILVTNMGEDVVIQVNISANPKPKVFWKIDEIVSITPSQSTIDKKYTARRLVPHPTLKCSWTADLLIKNVSDEDFATIFKLEANNSYGTFTDVLSIYKRDLQLITNDTQASVQEIIGFTISGFVIIVILIIIFVELKRRKKITSSKESIMEMSDIVESLP